MAVFLKILSVIDCILLAVLILLVWIAVMPRHFWVEYSKRDGFIAKMNIAIFKVTLYPQPSFLAKKDKKEEERAKRQEEKQNRDKGKEKTNIMENIEPSFDLVKQIVSAAKGVMKRVLKAIKFRDVSFTVPIYSGDIHSTQKTYGAVTSAFYTLNIFLQQNMQIYYKSPVFVADFAGRYKDAVYFYSKITASPALLIAAAYFAYKQYNNIMKNNKKTAEKEITNG